MFTEKKSYKSQCKRSKKSIKGKNRTFIVLKKKKKTPKKTEIETAIEVIDLCYLHCQSAEGDGRILPAAIAHGNIKQDGFDRLEGYFCVRVVSLLAFLS